MIGGHAVRIIGWGEGPDAIGVVRRYWLVANSWNTVSFIKINRSHYKFPRRTAFLIAFFITNFTPNFSMLLQRVFDNERHEITALLERTYWLIEPGPSSQIYT